MSGPDEAARPRAVVADDEVAVTMLIHHVLRRAGFEVLRAHGGGEALGLVRAQRPDVVLLDVMMPDLDGRDACRALKADEELREIPVVLFSSADEVDVDWRSAGADAFLRKPFDIRTLAALADGLLRPRP